ncbi:actin depolymerizing factor [Pyrrhoderma noxium]|uniref:Cofilin n=1 Tax=Pyrrhoderma noxium TaxID=2282107 RepID=A0A286UC10_9AGAM|nr:actin depolymerizing factor [Pyrrhoderma noxium]
MASGVTASEGCISVFNDLKLSRASKWILYKISNDNKEIIVQEKADPSSAKSNQEFFEEFTSKLPSDEPRYGVFDFEFEKEDGSGKRNRIVFVNWAPDSSKIKAKMVYSTSKDALRRGLVGVQIDVQATDHDEISYESVHEKCDKLR